MLKDFFNKINVNGSECFLAMVSLQKKKEKLHENFSEV